MTTNYNELAEQYAEHRRISPKILKCILAKARLDSSSNVLEVGCGTGNYIGAIRSAVRCNCFGVDPSENMLSEAVCQNVAFQIGSAESFVFQDVPFDLIFSVDVIHHVKNHTQFFRNAMSSLKEGGWFCTVTDSEDTIRTRLMSQYFPRVIETEIARYPTIVRLKELLKESKFEAISEEMTDYDYSLTDATPYQTKVYSALHGLSPLEFEQGIRRMEMDLKKGPIKAKSRNVILWARKTGAWN